MGGVRTQVTSQMVLVTEPEHRGFVALRDCIEEFSKKERGLSRYSPFVWRLDREHFSASFKPQVSIDNALRGFLERICRNSLKYANCMCSHWVAQCPNRTRRKEDITAFGLVHRLWGEMF